MAFYTLSLPTAQGLSIKFDSYQYNGTGADGINFILAAADPANPTAPPSTGPVGGSLGYTAAGTSPGVPYGYLGLGLDVWGNYTNTSFTGTGSSCATPGGITAATLYPQQLTARGPGNGLAGYCILGSTVQSGGLGGGASLDSLAATSRAGIAVPVEIAINPTNAVVTTASALNVPANSYLLAATPIGGTQKILTGTLPTTTNTPLLDSAFPPAWINPDTGIPYQLTLGWAASTGSANEIHEIGALQSSTLSGQLPVWDISSSIDGPNGKLPLGKGVNYTFTPQLDASQGAESEPVTVINTFPAGVTPGNASGNGWVCATVGQTVTCTYTPSGPAAPGSSLPPITVPATVSTSASGALTTTSKITSVDSFPAIVSRTDTIATVPNAPTSVSTNANGGTADVTWTAPSSDGGAPITQYKVIATPTSGAAITSTVSGSTTSTMLFGLAANTTYTITVEAINDVGSGATGSSLLTTAPQGYWLTGEDGGVFAFGNARFFGSATDLNLNQPIVGMTATPDKQGYWLVAADGGVFSYGNAKFYGSAGSLQLNKPIVGMASTPDGGGYWLVAADGGVFAYGNAKFHGSTGALNLAQPVVGMASARDGNGYWLVAGDGGVFSYGTSSFFGSIGGTNRTPNVVDIQTTPTGNGYWMVAADGALFAYGDAQFFGSGTDLRLKGPIIGLASTPSGNGYWLGGNEGGVFAYGDGRFLGSMAEQPLKKPITAITAS